MAELVRAYLSHSDKFMEFHEATPLLAQIRVGLLNGMPGVTAELIDSDAREASTPTPSERGDRSPDG